MRVGDFTSLVFLVDMSRFSTPEELENIYVRDVYDQIAPHFAHSKYKAWPKVEQFLCSFPAGSLIADIGKLVNILMHFLHLRIVYFGRF